MPGNKRLEKEMSKLQEKLPENIKVNMIGDDIFHWRALIFGQKDTSYDGGVFELDIIFPQEYPFKAPKCVFKTKIYHPNIDEKGQMSIKMLCEDWSPINFSWKVLSQISELIRNPQLESPMNFPVADQFKKDRDKFQATARQWTLKYANPANV